MADNYNWDDLDVGQFNLNHSENFFNYKHSKHEKFTDDLGFFEEMEKIENKENAKNATNIKDKSHREKKDGKNSSRKTPRNLMNQPFETKEKISTNDTNDVGKKQAPPRVYNYTEIYKKNKENRVHQVLEQERKNRIFHSRPAPNFNALHSKQQQQQNQQSADQCQLIACTMPETPMVYKRSREVEERRKKMLEEYKKKIEPQKFTSRSAQVLYEEPFRPKKQPHQLDMQPFNLHMEKRLQERKHFDEELNRRMEERRKRLAQEEEERRRQEENTRRKETVFKARRNPFK